MKERLDKAMQKRGLVETRSQAESYIRLGTVLVNTKPVKKTGFLVGENDLIELKVAEQYVSRAGLKLASISDIFELDFKQSVVLDVGSSTGGFTDYALQHDAKKVIAVDVGTNQLHPKLRADPRVELHEQTDIRDLSVLSSQVDIIVIDVSFISLRDVLPHIKKLATQSTKIVAMAKPQFEATVSSFKHKGVIKNEAMRRSILKDFEEWAKQYFIISNKADSQVSGEKGNRERFYLLKSIK
jgi:23S rRNA (cytidine1920-2'-O)/16S rRNA (cytidine1409-2'-O)-methyltransferase